MWKTLFSAAFASALLAGAAHAQTAQQPSAFDRSKAESERQPGGAHAGAQARGDAAGAPAARLGPACEGVTSEQEVTRCLNRQSLASLGEAERDGAEPAPGAAAGGSQRDSMRTQGSDGDK